MRKSENPPHAAPLRLATVSQLVGILNGALTKAAIRSQIWAAESRTLKNGHVIPANGLASAVIRIGHKVLIDVDRYFKWLEDRRLAPLHEPNDAQAKETA